MDILIVVVIIVWVLLFGFLLVKACIEFLEWCLDREDD